MNAVAGELHVHELALAPHADVQRRAGDAMRRERPTVRRTASLEAELVHRPVRRCDEKGKVRRAWRERLPNHDAGLRPRLRRVDADDARFQIAVIRQLDVLEMKLIRRSPDVRAGTGDGEGARLNACGAGKLHGADIRTGPRCRRRLRQHPRGMKEDDDKHR